jgi:hypothetical protein
LMNRILSIMYKTGNLKSIRSRDELNLKLLYIAKRQRLFLAEISQEPQQREKH